MGEIILCNLNDSVSILNEKRKEWVINILQILGYELQNFDDINLFRSEMNSMGIYIETKQGGEEIDIYKMKWHEEGKEAGWLPVDKKYLVAQWKKPKYIRKRDKNGLYYELHFNEWSMIK